MERLYTLKEAKRLLGVQTKLFSGGIDREKWGWSEPPAVEDASPRARYYGYGVKEKRKEELLDMLVFRLLRRRTIQSVKYPYIKSRWVEEIYTDVGPRLNDRRRSFKRILKRVVKKDISRIIISHPDWLTLLGFACSRRWSPSCLLPPASPDIGAVWWLRSAPILRSSYFLLKTYNKYHSLYFVFTQYTFNNTRRTYTYL